MEVKGRAPGKIILAGEHSVVHRSTAVAASVDLFTYVSIRFPPPSENDDALKLQLKDLALEFSWPIGRIRKALPELICPFPSTPSSCSNEFIKSISALVEEQKIPEADNVLASGVCAFIWLYVSILGFKPGTVVVTSELPMGSGLGSSASFSVALTSALLALSSSVGLDMNKKGWFAFGESELELLNKWAFEGEKIIHGKPSGIDNTVSAYGNMIKFKSGDLTRINSSVPLKMLITNTKVERSTKALVAAVSERTLRYPDAMQSVFDAVDSISKELSIVVQSPITDDISITKMEEKIAELMEMNQGLLLCMGVSHASIETVLQTTSKYNLTSKLTGAGGGGCVLTLLPTLLSGTVIDNLIADLDACGFQCLIAGTGGNGAQICFSGTT